MGLSKKQLPYIAATIVLFVGGVLFFAFPIRNLMTAYLPSPRLMIIPIIAVIYMGILYLFVVSTFFLASFVDPGIYPREHTDEEDDFRTPLYKQIEVNGIQVKMKWCETCKFYRPPRCSHCSICDNCVENFDHHCPWVDNCIGRRNYKYFFFFVTSLTLFILSGFGWGVVSILANTGMLTNVIVEFILMFIGVLVFIPVVGLAGFHIGLVCMGRTTNEHVTGKFRGNHNPYDMGCARNCLNILCSPKKPRYMHYQMKVVHSHSLSSPGRRPPPQLSQGHDQDLPSGARDLRCMPVYEELDNNSLPRAPLQQPNGLQGAGSVSQDMREVTV